MTSFPVCAFGPVVGPVQVVTGAAACVTYSLAIVMNESSAAWAQANRQCTDCRRSQQAPANQTKSQHPFLPVRCWQTIGSPSRLSRRFSDGQVWPSTTGNWAISLETRAALLAPSLDLARYELVERRCAGAARR